MPVNDTSTLPENPFDQRDDHSQQNSSLLDAVEKLSEEEMRAIVETQLQSLNQL